MEVSVGLAEAEGQRYGMVYYGNLPRLQLGRMPMDIIGGMWYSIVIDAAG